MPNSATSTVPAFKAALVAGLTTALNPVQVGYSWPGPTTEAEGVYLGREVDGTMGIASLKTGRQRRDERYRVEIVCQTFRAAGADTPAAADDAEARAFVLAGEVEDWVADDASPSSLGPAGWGQLVAFSSSVEPFEHGWSARVVLVLEANARLH